MYGLPEGVDLSFLLDKQVESVSLSPHQVILRFDDRISINSSSTMEVSAGGATVRSDDPRLLGPVLIQLLTEAVSDVRWSTDGTLQLIFVGGGSLQLEDDASPFESYEIQHGADLIVV